MKTDQIQRQRGAGLIESMIAIVILSFGILGLARFQIGMLLQGTDAQSRLAASAMAEELLALVRVDVQNAPCYTLPAQSSCTSTFAVEQARAWSAKVASTVPGLTSHTATMPDASRFDVVLTWSSKAFKEGRTLKVTTDVRP